MEKNPMEMGPILRCVFKQLDVKGIKNCRFVSKEWNSFAKLALRNVSKIVFSKPNRTISKFYDEFSGSINLPFTGFKFKDGEKWTMEELNDFFERHQEKMEVMELESITVVDQSGEAITNFDITPWILGSPITDSNLKCLTKLSIVCNSNLIMVPLNLLVSVRELSLINCLVSFKKGVQIKPMELTLNNVLIQDDTIPDQLLIINDMVDFSKAKKVHLNLKQRLMVLWDSLYSVKDISLKYVNVSFITRTEINPINLTLNSVGFWNNGIRLVEVPINDFVNFFLAESVNLQSETYVVKFDLFANVKNLCLKECTTTFRKGFKICPIKLNLEIIKFRQKGNLIEEMRINDIVNFCKAKNVILKSTNTIQLDLNGNGEKVVLESLEMSRVKVVNWASSTWKIMKMETWMIPILEKVCAEIVEFDFSFSKIILPFLPKSIQRLSIFTNAKDIYPGCSPISLPNLRHFRLDTMQMNSSKTDILCSDLVDLYIDEQLPIKVEWIPKGIEKLELSEIQMIFLDKKDGKFLNLFTFTYNEYFYKLANNWNVEGIIPQEVLVQRNMLNKTSDLLGAWEILAKISNYFLIGPLDWTKMGSFWINHFKSFTDKIAEYYSFENEMGRGITESEFMTVKNKYKL